MKKVLVTGAAGFIGSNLCKKLVSENYQVIGVDNLNDYYDVSLKEYRLKQIDSKNFIFVKEDINNENKIREVFNEYKPEIVVHLAACAGIRYSIDNPDIYVKTNIDGFYNVLKVSKEFKVEHFIFASSSSIYGNSKTLPFKEEYAKVNQESIYGSTKMCEEVLACSYSKIFDLPITAIRPFTVYGPCGRPDMAYFGFTNKLLNKEEISLYNNGELKRDYTFITDAIDGIYSIIKSNPKPGYDVYNIGGSRQYTTKDLVEIIKKELIENDMVDKDYNFGKYIKYVKMKKGEVYETYSDISKMKETFNYNPKVTLEEGLKEFIKWYKSYYKK